MSCHSSSSLSQGGSADQAAPASMRDTSFSNLNTLGTASAWIMNDSADLSETRLLEEQLLRAGILASLRDAPDNADEKVEVSKSSVSSLRSVIHSSHTERCQECSALVSNKSNVLQNM